MKRETQQYNTKNDAAFEDYYSHLPRPRAYTNTEKRRLEEDTEVGTAERLMQLLARIEIDHERLEEFSQTEGKYEHCKKLQDLGKLSASGWVDFYREEYGITIR